MGTVEIPQYPTERPTGEPADVEGEGNKDGSDTAKDVLCSAQLLHLDHAGRPLWFNGWMERHKFIEHKGSEFEPVPFDVFVKEPKLVPTGGVYTSPWDIRNDNIICIEALDPLEFSDGEKKVLTMLQSLAKGGTELV